MSATPKLKQLHQSGATDGQAAIFNTTSGLWEPKNPIKVQDEGVAVTSTPHQTLNFTGAGVTVTNAGSGVATVNVSGAAASALPAVQARRTTNLVLTTSFADATMDTTDEETNSAVLEHDSVNTDRILIKETGLYLVSYSISVDLFNAANSISSNVNGQVRKNDTTVLPGSEYRKGDHWSFSTSISEDAHLGPAFLASLTAGDFLTPQFKFSDDTGTLTIEKLHMMVVKLQGTKGDQGIAGSGTSITVKEDGTNVANTPHTALNFAEGVVASDSGAGVATIQGGLIKTDFTELSADTTTTSTTHVDLLSLSYTKVLASSALLIHVSAACSINASDRFTRFRLQIDGVTKRGFAIETGTTGEGDSGGLVMKVTGLASGTRTIKVQWLTEASTSSIRPATTDYEHCSILVQEVIV